MMFNYILFAIAKKSKRILIDYHDVNKYIKESECFVSLWFYDQEAYNYFQKDKSLKGYKGKMFSPYLPFDIDASNLEEAIRETKILLLDLKSQGLSYSLKFSGKKGFHVIVDSKYFGGFEPSESLPDQLSNLTKNLTSAKIDPSIYKRGSLFRIENTKHDISGLYKIPIKEDELNLDVIELAKEKRYLKLPKVEINPIKKLILLKEKTFNVVEVVESKPKNKLCINKLMKGVDSGERNEALCVITSFLREEGFNQEIAYNVIKKWNGYNKPPLEETLPTFKSVFNSKYTYGCHYWLKDKYCDSSCFLYRDKNKIKKSNIEIVTMREAKDSYIKQIEDERGVLWGFSEKIDKLIRGHYPSQIAFLLGRPGTYKSTIGQMIGEHFVNNYFGNFLYVSMEMSLSMLFERHMEILYNKAPKILEKEYKSLEYDNDHFLIIDKTGLTPGGLKETIEKWQDKHNEKIEMIVIDYLHALKKGNTKDNAVEQNVRGLEEMNKALDSRTVVLTHTSRKGGGDAYKPLSIEAGRDTSAIEDVAYMLLGAHKIRENENALCVQLLKNKNGATYQAGVLLERSPDSVHLQEMSKDLYEEN